MFIIVANFAGLLPVGVVPGVHAFTVTSHVTVTAMLALISFATVLFVGFARHGLQLFSLFVPHGVPAWMLPIIVPVELISFMIRPFSLALRLFVAIDRKSVGQGKSVSGRVDPGGRRILKQKKTTHTKKSNQQDK